MNLGDLVSETRMMHCKSQADLAKHLNVHPTYISKIERNVYIPPLEAIQKICAYLSIPIDKALPYTRYHNLKPSDFGMSTEHGSITKAEMHLVAMYRKVSEYDKDLINALLQYMEKI